MLLFCFKHIDVCPNTHRLTDKSFRCQQKIYMIILCTDTDFWAFFIFIKIDSVYLLAKVNNNK